MITHSARAGTALALVAVVLSACSTSSPAGPPDANTVTLTPRVGKFTSISVGTAFSATTVRGSAPSVRITVPESVKDRVVARTDGDELQISLDEGAEPVGDHALLATVVVAQPLRGVTAQEAATIDATASGTLGREIRLDAHQAATVAAVVNATSLTVEASQSATITAAGQAGTATVNATQASTFRGFDLQARAVTATAESASTIEVTATATLIGRANQASTIRYRGQPQTNVDKDVSSTVQPG